MDVEQSRGRSEPSVGRPHTRQAKEHPIFDGDKAFDPIRYPRTFLQPPTQSRWVIRGLQGAARALIKGARVDLSPQLGQFGGGSSVRPGHRQRQRRSFGVDRQQGVHRSAQRQPPDALPGHTACEFRERLLRTPPHVFDILFGPALSGRVKGILPPDDPLDLPGGGERNRFAAGGAQVETDDDTGRVVYRTRHYRARPG